LPYPVRASKVDPDALQINTRNWVRFPNERNQRKQAHPVFKYRVPLRVPWFGLAPAALEFWVRFPNELRGAKTLDFEKL
jgi:hypothetical protein